MYRLPVRYWHSSNNPVRPRPAGRPTSLVPVDRMSGRMLDVHRLEPASLKNTTRIIITPLRARMLKFRECIATEVHSAAVIHCPSRTDVNFARALVAFLCRYSKMDSCIIEPLINI